MYTIKIEIQPRTPIFTGGINKNMDRIHAASIRGSMRFWTEVLFRSLGGSVCDCTEQAKSCPKTDENGNPQVCDVCAIFGCTGKKSWFDLKIESDYTPEKNRSIEFQYYNYNYTIPDGNTKPFSLIFTLKPQPFSTNITAENLGTFLILLITFMSRHGYLGAKAQQGYGLFEISNITLNNALFKLPSSASDPLKDFYELISARSDRRISDRDTSQYRLKNYFHRTIRFTVDNEDKYLETIMATKQNLFNKFLAAGILSSASHFRYTLRSGWRADPGNHTLWGIRDCSIRHKVFGDRKQRSSLYISQAYKASKESSNEYEIRLYGFGNISHNGKTYFDNCILTDNQNKPLNLDRAQLRDLFPSKIGIKITQATKFQYPHH